MCYYCEYIQYKLIIYYYYYISGLDTCSPFLVAHSQKEHEDVNSRFCSAQQNLFTDRERHAESCNRHHPACEKEDQTIWCWFQCHRVNICMQTL